MKYLNFELSVDARDDGKFDVRTHSPAGDARAQITFPFDAGELAGHIAALERALELSRSSRDIVRPKRPPTPPLDLPAVQRFGTSLFNALLTNKVLSVYRNSLAIARVQEAGLRIQLRLQPPEIAALPWEFMFDPDDKSFVCLNPNTPIVRYPEIDIALTPISIKLPLRILGMMASPGDLPALNESGEVERIKQGIAALQSRKLVELSWVKGGSYRDLQAALRDGPWHVFHYIGHGGFEGDDHTGAGILAFEAAPEIDGPVAPKQMPALHRGLSHNVSSDDLGQLLRGHASLRLVVLNSCLGARANGADAFSSIAATLVRRGVSAVVAMQYEISDRAALTFAQAFYASLAAGTPVDRAVADARFDLRAGRKNSLEWATPVLLMRSPDGILFTPDRPPPPPNRHHWPTALVAGGAALPLAAAALLSIWRVSGADVSLIDAHVTGVGVTLPAQRALAEPIEVTKLGVSGLRSLTLSRSAQGRRTLSTDKLLLTALQEPDRAGRLTLNLSGIVPKGTGVTLAVGDEPGSYVIKLDSIRDLTVPTSGPVQVIVPGILDEQIDFQNSGSVWLRSRGRLTRLEFTPVVDSGSLFGETLPANGLKLIRYDPYVTGERSELRAVSTIRSGRLAIGGGGERQLVRGEMLRVGVSHGDISQLELAGDYLRLTLSARVDSLTSGPDSSRRNLLPSVLGWTLAKHGGWLAGAAALYLASLMLVIHLWIRRTR